MIKRLTKREQKIFIFLVIIAVAYAALQGVIKPLNEKILFVKNKIEKRKKHLDDNLRIVNKGRKREEQYNYYLNKFKQNQSNEQVMSSMLSEIEGVARSLNLRISDLKPQKAQETNYYNRFSVSLTIDSELAEIIHFIYELQNQTHLFNVDEVRFDKGARRNTSTLKTNLVLSKIFIP